MVNVLICEDQTLMRKGLVALLELDREIVIVGEAVNGAEAVDKVAALKPDVVLMDLQMPLMDGVAATRAITSRYPCTRVIILTTHDSADNVFEGVKAGAMGYLLKDSDPHDLVQTIRRVHCGEHFIQPTIASNILFDWAKGTVLPPGNAPCAPLNGREIAIVRCLAHGMGNRAIAEELSLAEGTIKNLVSSILAKLHAANRVQAVNLARQQRII